MAEYHKGPLWERTFPSTQWHWEDGSLRRGGAPESQHRPQGDSIYRLRARDPRKPLDCVVRYVGGPEGTYEIRSRGWRWRCSGTVALNDVMRWINRQDGGR